MAQSPEHAARVLGLIGEPTLDEVKRARRNMALRYHPDQCADKEQATRHMARINAAADTLTAYLKSRAQPKAQPNTQKTQYRSHRAEAEPKETSAHNSSKAKEDASAAKTRQRKPRNQDAHAVNVKTASDAVRRAWKADRALARRAAHSYQSVLSRIGKGHMRPAVDVQILRFETA